MTVLVESTAQVTGRLVAGRYRLRALLGRGGMGRVWLAEDELLAREVAVKQVLFGGAVAADTRASALHEARVLARLDHPGVVRVHDLVEDGEDSWIVMERLAGKTLAEAVKAYGRLPVDEVNRIARCLLDALEAVHEAGLLHCDVKPANVHLCDDGRVVLTDFGIACASDVTLPGDGIAGSPAYLSPERARGDQLGRAADLFSLGATLYAAVEGRPPFGSGDPFTTLVAVLEDDPPPADHAGELRPIIDGLLAKKPSHRLTTTQARSQL